MVVTIVEKGMMSMKTTRKTPRIEKGRISGNLVVLEGALMNEKA